MKNINFFIGDLIKLEFKEGYIFLRSKKLSDWELYKNQNRFSDVVLAKSFRINANDIFCIVDVCHSKEWNKQYCLCYHLKHQQLFMVLETGLSSL